MTNSALDDRLQSFIRDDIKANHGVDLPTKPGTIPERHEEGRVRREATYLRRRLQSHPGEPGHGADRDNENDGEEDDDYDSDENEGPRPFLREAPYAVRLADRNNLDLDMTFTSERVGDICSDLFAKTVTEPIRTMMKDAGVDNPFSVGGKTVRIKMMGLKIPGLVDSQPGRVPRQGIDSHEGRGSRRCWPRREADNGGSHNQGVELPFPSIGRTRYRCRR